MCMYVYHVNIHMIDSALENSQSQTPTNCEYGFTAFAFLPTPQCCWKREKCHVHCSQWRYQEAISDGHWFWDPAVVSFGNISACTEQPFWQATECMPDFSFWWTLVKRSGSLKSGYLNRGINSDRVNNIFYWRMFYICFFSRSFLSLRLTK